MCVEKTFNSVPFDFRITQTTGSPSLQFVLAVALRNLYTYEGLWRLCMGTTGSGDL